MRRLLISWAVLAGAIAITAGVLPGVDVHGGFLTYLWIAVVFALVNALLGRVLRLLTAPLIVLTLGLFALVVNALLFLVTSWISDSLHVDGFLTALAAALIISVVDAILELLLRVGRHSARVS
jgi:putative membrane protein